MKKFVIFLYLILSVAISSAQKKPSTYTVHKGDSWYSIARKFNISYAELRMANKKFDDKLPVGKKLTIPRALKSNDPFFNKNKMDEGKKSVSAKPESQTHKVSGSETLFSIAKKYNVKVDELKKWNNLRSNEIRKGQVLTIYTNSSATVNTQTISTKSEDKSIPVVNPDKKLSPTTESSKEITPDKKPISEINEDIKNGKSDKPIIFGNGRKEVNETGVAAWIEDEAINPNKYYALHRNAPIGTIIKVINRMNNRSVYVKVVGKLPETGENEGLLIKISKAGADKLGVLDNRFQTQLVYGITEASSR